MNVTFSEFMGCEDFSKAELCMAIDALGERIIERDELILDMYAWLVGSERKAFAKRIKDLGFGFEVEQ